MSNQNATATLKPLDTVKLEEPTPEDGAGMWDLVSHSTLDQNSCYKYIMMCEYFSETCVVAKEEGKIVGFVTAFIPPEKQDVLFVWQVGVDSSQRGKGIASRMLQEIFNREACQDVRFLEATVTPSNKASQSLFKGFAKKNNTKCDVSELFSKDLFPSDEHEEELRFRIGPVNK
ncbi:diaminobutyrate acetyltransferase [Piscibacillus halophilus]|nr:diaminobutyrate acetyltransferase [Piscibacillus halophilus]